MRSGPDKVIVYLNGVLCAMDRQAKITIPVSRWKLAEIGLACFLGALRGKGAASRPAEPLPAFELRPEALPEARPQAPSEPSPEAKGREEATARESPMGASYEGNAGSIALMPALLVARQAQAETGPQSPSEHFLRIPHHCLEIRCHEL
jgi:hypothetical protein